jgi:hypothetical protein
VINKDWGLPLFGDSVGEAAVEEEEVEDSPKPESESALLVTRSGLSSVAKPFSSRFGLRIAGSLEMDLGGDAAACLAALARYPL